VVITHSSSREKQENKTKNYKKEDEREEGKRFETLQKLYYMFCLVSCGFPPCCSRALFRFGQNNVPHLLQKTRNKYESFNSIVHLNQYISLTQIHKIPIVSYFFLGKPRRNFRPLLHVWCFFSLQAKTLFCRFCIISVEMARIPQNPNIKRRSKQERAPKQALNLMKLHEKSETQKAEYLVRGGGGVPGRFECSMKISQ